MYATLQRAGPSNGYASTHHDICAFCDEGLNIGHPTKKTRCGHRFHTHCMNYWLPQTKKCPLCETAIPKWKNITNRCVVCYDLFNEFDDIMKPACNHQFHEDCIRQLLQTKHRCPICRRNIYYMIEQLHDATDSEHDDNEEEEDQLVEEDSEDARDEEDCTEEVEEEQQDCDAEEDEYYSEEDTVDNTCAICSERFEDSENPIRRTRCGHLLHIHCMNSYLPQAKKCPVCDSPIKWIDVTDKCVVCFDMFQGTDERQQLPCSHQSHSDCLDQLMVKKKRCPVCKRKITYQMPQECSICLEEIVIGDIVMRLSCEHEFHNTCVSSWLQDESTCPLCRSSVH